MGSGQDCVFINKTNFWRELSPALISLTPGVICYVLSPCQCFLALISLSLFFVPKLFVRLHMDWSLCCIGPIQFSFEIMDKICFVCSVYIFLDTFTWLNLPAPCFGFIISKPVSPLDLNEFIQLLFLGNVVIFHIHFFVFPGREARMFICFHLVEGKERNTLENIYFLYKKKLHSG